LDVLLVAMIEDVTHQTKTFSTQYVSFLLRIWRSDDQKGRWRATVEEPGTGVQHHFANLEALLTFISSQSQNVNQ
jgi:hypothetical protein